MKRKLLYTMLLINTASYAGGKHDPKPTNPLQPNFYVSNDNRSNANASANNANTVNAQTHATGGNSTSSASSTGGAGGGGGSAVANGGVGGAGGHGGGGGMGGGGGSVGDVSLQNHTTYEQRRIPVNTAYAAGLTSSGEDTCLGSMSGGAQHAVFGISLAKTVTDANCVKLKRSKMLASLGEQEAALALWCDEPDMKQALLLAGITCDGLHHTRYKRLLAQEVIVTPAPVAVIEPKPTPAPQCRKPKAKKRVCK